MRRPKVEKLAQIEPRLALRQMERLEDTISLLRLAASGLRRLGRSDEPLHGEITRLTNQLNLLRQRAQLPIMAREKPKLTAYSERTEAPRYHVFLDECGTRWPKPQAAFPYFCVAAAIFEKTYYERTVRPAMHALKRKYWPERENVVFHEPDMRRRRGKFYFEGDAERQDSFAVEYEAMLRQFDLRAVAVVVDKAELQQMVQMHGLDMYLPSGIYAIAYDFLLEAVCELLHHECRDGLGSLFPESVGNREDAELQFEHARIFLEGTRTVSGSWLQYQLRPGLRFFRKGEAEGNEIADTLARTVADHAKGLGESAAHWEWLEPKLYCGRSSPSRPWGTYKVFPVPGDDTKNAPDDKASDAPLGTKP